METRKSWAVEEQGKLTDNSMLKCSKPERNEPHEEAEASGLLSSVQTVGLNHLSGVSTLGEDAGRH